MTIRIYSSRQVNEGAFLEMRLRKFANLTKPDNPGNKSAICFEVDDDLIAARQQYLDPQTTVNLQEYLAALASLKHRLYLTKINY